MPTNTGAFFRRSLVMKMMSSTAALRGIALALALAASGCSNMAKPGPQSIAGMSPVGTVQMNEVIAVGATAGTGTLNFQGRSYSFKLAGGVTRGGGASDARARGGGANLRDLSGFAGA